MRTIATLALLLAGACRQSEPPAKKQPTPPTPTAVTVPALDAATPRSVHGCADTPTIVQLAPGLTLETRRPPIAPAAPSSDRCLRVLRADPAHFDVVLGSASREAGKTAPVWAAEFGAVAVTNASMFHADGSSTGLLIDDDRVLTAKENGQFGAFFAAGATPGSKRAPVAMWGRGCAGDSVEALRRDYRLIVQNYRLLDCDGRAIPWKDEKIYSAAAVGLDSSGHILFILSRAPYRMATFTRLLVTPELELDLVAAMYVEGGPEATLAINARAHRALFLGSYESRFLENDHNQAAWKLPNVLMLVPRG